MSGKIWDAKKEEDLLSVIDTLNTEHGDAVHKIEEIGKGGDASLSDEDQNARLELMAQMKVTESKLAVRQAELSRMRLFKPEDKLPSMVRDERIEELDSMMRDKKQATGQMSIDIEAVSNWMARRGHSEMLQRSDLGGNVDNAAEGATEKRTEHTLIDSLKAYGAGMEVVSMITTDDGNAMLYPVADSTGAQGSMLANEAATINPVAAAAVTDVELVTKRFTSGFKPVSNTLITDSVFDVVSHTMMEVGRSIGRAISDKIINGTTADGIDGIVNFAPTVELSRAAYAVVDKTIELEHKPDRAYLSGGERGMWSNLNTGAGLTSRGGYQGFIVSYDMLRILRTALDGENRPLWNPSIVPGAPGTIFGQPVKVVDEMDDYSNSANSSPIAFGNFSYCTGRFVKNLIVHKFLDSATMGTDHTTFVGIARYGQKMTLKADSAGKNPAIAVGVTSAS